MLFLSSVEKAGLRSSYDIQHHKHYVHYHWHSSVICNVIRKQGRAIRDVSWKDTQGYHMMDQLVRSSEWEGGRKNCVGSNAACINMYYIDQISIKFHYFSCTYGTWNEPLCYRVTGFTFSVELMDLNIMEVLSLYPVLRIGFYPCWITTMGFHRWWISVCDCFMDYTFIDYTFSFWFSFGIHAGPRVNSKSGDSSVMTWDVQDVVTAAVNGSFFPFMNRALYTLGEFSRDQNFYSEGCRIPLLYFLSNCCWYVVSVFW